VDTDFQVEIDLSGGLRIVLSTIGTFDLAGALRIGAIGLRT
jgi:hypothetical protein